MRKAYRRSPDAYGADVPLERLAAGNGVEQNLFRVENTFDWLAMKLSQSVAPSRTAR